MNDEKRVAVFILAFVKNEVMRFDPDAQRHAADRDGACTDGGGGRFERQRRFAHRLWNYRRGRVELRAVQIHCDLVDVRKNARAEINDLAILGGKAMSGLVQSLGEVGFRRGKLFAMQRNHFRMFDV